MCFGCSKDRSLEYICTHNICFGLEAKDKIQEADSGFLKRGFICIKVWGFSLLILSHFS